MNASESSPSILIVDDEAPNRFLLDNILAPTYNVLSAKNGTEALVLATSSSPPSVILLDIMMPDMDGFEVIQQLKNNTATSNIPVIFISAKTFAEDEERGLTLGAVDFITKPFRIRTIIAKVAIHVELFQQRQFMESLAEKQFKAIANNAITQCQTHSKHKQTIQEYLLNIHDNEERLRLALSATETELWDWNLLTGEILRSNKIDDSLLPEKCPPNSTESFEKYIHPKDYPNFKQVLNSHFTGVNNTYDIEFRIKTPSKTWEWRHAIGRITHRNEKGLPTRLLGTLRNITHRKNTEEQLKIIALSYESTSDGIWIANANQECIMINKAYTHITGYSDNEIIGKPFLFSRIENQQQQITERAHTSLQKEGHWNGEIPNERKNSVLYTEALRISVIHDEDGEITHYIGVFSDISLRKKSEEDLRKLANYDPLTGLPNRALFVERLEQEFKERRNVRYQFALLFLDLDNFKKINDSLGHDAGDKLLQEVAKRLHKCCRERDTVARLGGDEFTFIIQDIDDPHVAAKTAQRILEELEPAITIDDNDLINTASIGIAIFPKDGNNMGQLMRHADTAMYSAKSKGKNSYQFFDQEIKDQALARLELEQDLRQAVNNNEIVLHYQPKVNLLSGLSDGVEVLVRWLSKSRGLVSPNDFIPIAEETGIILNLGNHILETACLQYKRWLDKDIVDHRMSVNVSGSQFMQPGFLQQVDDILVNTKLPGKYLELEITESMLIHDTEKAIEIMQSLRDRDISLAIDDFGTGFSSLNYLKRFPVNTLKIDRSFIIDILTSIQDQNIVKSIIQLGQCLDLEIVIEGIETMEQANELRTMEAHIMQGFLYSKPLPSDKYELFLTKNVNLYTNKQ